jgi:hypothetical protein
MSPTAFGYGQDAVGGILGAGTMMLQAKQIANCDYTERLWRGSSSTIVMNDGMCSVVT